jgi:hypothetical protein
MGKGKENMRKRISKCLISSTSPVLWKNVEKARQERQDLESMIEGKTGIFNLKGGDGNPNYKLIQTEGTGSGNHNDYKGIYEYIMNDKGQITHERFVKDGKITGTVGGGTGGGARK